MSKIVKIKINNWKKYNNSRSREWKRPWWFACSNNIHIDQDFLHFNAEEKWTWICLLCEASVQRKDSIIVDFDHHSSIWCIKKVNLSEAIKKLESLYIISTNFTDVDRNYNNNNNNNNRKHRYVETDVSHPTDVGLSALKIFELYNQNCESLPKATTLNSKRERLGRQAAKEFVKAGFGEEDFVKLVKFIAKDDFYSGKNDRGWRASFDFIIRPGKLIELLEKSTSTGVKKESFEEYLRRQGRLDENGKLKRDD